MGIVCLLTSFWPLTCLFALSTASVPKNNALRSRCSSQLQHKSPWTYRANLHRHTMHAHKPETQFCSLIKGNAQPWSWSQISIRLDNKPDVFTKWKTYPLFFLFKFNKRNIGHQGWFVVWRTNRGYSKGEIPMHILSCHLQGRYYTWE